MKQRVHLPSEAGLLVRHKSYLCQWHYYLKDGAINFGAIFWKKQICFEAATKIAVLTGGIWSYRIVEIWKNLAHGISILLYQVLHTYHPPSLAARLRCLRFKLIPHSVCSALHTRSSDIFSIFLSTLVDFSALKSRPTITLFNCHRFPWAIIFMTTQLARNAVIYIMKIPSAEKQMKQQYTPSSIIKSPYYYVPQTLCSIKNYHTNR